MNTTVLDQTILILAGGLGTRLKHVLPDCPKVLAPVEDRTFLDLVLLLLYARGFRRVVLLLGYRHEIVLEHLEQTAHTRPADLQIESSIEAEPLGTAGAIKHAASFCCEPFFLINGDTYFDFDPHSLIDAHRRLKPLVTMAARHVSDTSRFGSLEIDTHGRLRRFREKQADDGPGLINAGVYLVAPRLLDYIPESTASSLEIDVLPQILQADERVHCLAQEQAFFDIGTPDSYRAFLLFVHQKAATKREMT